MAKDQQHFFATKEDSVSLLRPIEDGRQLQFVRTGLFDTSELDVTPSLAVAPGLGLAPSGNTVLEPTYLVAPRSLPIQVRPVPQRKGGIKYAVDQLVNPKTIAFHPGGVFQEGCLISGEISTAAPDDPDSMELMKLFLKAIRRQFTKVNAYYVGKRAEELLDAGWRLTATVRAPVLYDLKRDEPVH